MSRYHGILPRNDPKVWKTGAFIPFVNNGLATICIAVCSLYAAPLVQPVSFFHHPCLTLLLPAMKETLPNVHLLYPAHGLDLFGALSLFLFVLFSVILLRPLSYSRTRVFSPSPRHLVCRLPQSVPKATSLYICTHMYKRTPLQQKSTRASVLKMHRRACSLGLQPTIWEGKTKVVWQWGALEKRTWYICTRSTSSCKAGQLSAHPCHSSPLVSLPLLWPVSL